MADLQAVSKISNGQPLDADTLNAPLDDLETNQDLINTEVGEVKQTVDNVKDSVSAINTALAPEGYVGDWSEQTGSAAVPYSVSHNGAFWEAVGSISDVTLSEPSEGNTEWTKSTIDITQSVSGYVTQTAIAMSIVFGG